MKKLSEDQVKEILNINNFRELSKDKIIRFVAMMPEMDKEVAMKMIEKFPEFTKFAKEVMNSLEEDFKLSIESNDKSQKETFKVYEETRKILEKELDREELPDDVRKEIISHLLELVDKTSIKDSENKEFLKGVFKDSLSGKGLLVLTGLVFIGGRIFIEKD